MGRTRGSPHEHALHTGTPVAADTLPTSTKQVAAPRSKRSRANSTAVVELEKPAPAKKAKMNSIELKRQREGDDPATVEPEKVVSTKKAKTTPASTEKDSESKDPEPQGAARRSNRPQTKTPAARSAPQKRKRRTQAEIAADKAKAEAEKKRQEELTAENHRAMIKMDINEDINREEAAARTIRTFADIENDGEEEFVGYEDIEGSDSESDGQAEDALTLKVRFSVKLSLVKHSPHLTGGQQGASEANRGPQSPSRGW
jgi:hypothetical protein